MPNFVEIKEREGCFYVHLHIIWCEEENYKENLMSFRNPYLRKTGTAE